MTASGFCRGIAAQGEECLEAGSEASGPLVQGPSHTRSRTQEHSVHTALAYLRSATCHTQKMELLFTRVLMLECKTNLFLF